MHPFSKKGDLGNTKNYRGITLTDMAMMVYNARLPNRNRPEVEKILRKIKMNSGNKSIHILPDSDYLSIHQRSMYKKSWDNTFCSFSQGIQFYTQNKILLAYYLPKETVTALMMFYKNTKLMVRSLNGDWFLYRCRWSCGKSYKVKLATVIKANQKAPSSIATTLRCRGGHYSIPCIAPLSPWSVPYIAECKARRHQVPLFASLLWLDRGLNPSLLDHWWTF